MSRRKNNVYPFKRHKWRPRRPKFRLPRNGRDALVMIVLFVLYFIVTQGDWSWRSTSDNITCAYPRIIDGDTFDCSGTRIRLQGIDTPEMPGHCREGRRCTEGDPHAARDRLVELTKGDVICRPEDKDVYGRTIARCKANDKDLSCAMLDSGHAVRRYAFIACF